MKYLIFAFFILAARLDAQTTTLARGKHSSTGQPESQVPTGFAVTACPAGPVDLVIYNGVSGEMVPDAEEETKGAVTVANFNSTDGDDIADYQDPLIQPLLSGQGANVDLDMMKIVLNRPLNSPDASKVYLKKLGGSIRLWRSPDKQEQTGGEVGFIGGKVTFLAKELPQTLYVEATNYSTPKLPENPTGEKDIILALEYDGIQDVVKATALWVVLSRVWTQRVGCEPSPICIENPEPVNGPLDRLRALNGSSLQDRISENISIDGSRYGHGTCRRDAPTPPNKDQTYGGRILFEFLIYPTAVNFSLYDVYFDCTRQRKLREMIVEHGEVTGNICLDGNVRYKCQEFPQDDSANDDEQSGDEDNTPAFLNESYDGYPKGYRIYSRDRPAISDLYSTLSKKQAFWVTKLTFREFVRIKVGEDFASGTNIQADGNGLIGSRASNKIDWHTVFYTRSGASNILIPDDQNISASEPQKDGTGKNGNGTCSITFFASAKNAAYRLYYDSATTTWTLVDISSGPTPISTGLLQGGSNPRQWIIVSAFVRVVITEDPANPFGGVPNTNSSSTFTFTVFRSTAGKVNETNIGYYPIENGF